MVVYTVGTFDLLHVGHLALLEYCNILGSTVAVGVASDEVVMMYKASIPVIPLDQRIKMLKALSCVNIVIPYYKLNYLTVCKEVKADIFVIGEDWGAKTHNKEIEKYMRKQGKKIVQIKYSPETSSTRIRNTVISIRDKGKRN